VPTKNFPEEDKGAGWLAYPHGLTVDLCIFLCPTVLKSFAWHKGTGDGGREYGIQQRLRSITSLPFTIIVSRDAVQERHFKGKAKKT
jgi:hypothetical protein